MNQAALLGQLIGYGLTATLALLLAAFVWKYPGDDRGPRVLFALCAGVWSLGGLTRFGLLAGGVEEGSVLLSWVQSVTFSAAAIWPASLSLLWSNTSGLSARELAVGRWLVRCAIATAVLLVGAWLVAAIRQAGADPLSILVAYNAAAVLSCGGALVYRHLSSATERVAVALIALGPLLTLVMHELSAAEILSARWSEVVHALAKQSIVLTILGGLLYLGRFRGVDRLAKLGLRITLVWGLGVAAAWLILRPMAALSTHSVAPAAVSLALSAAIIALTVLAFVLLGGVVGHWVDRRVFGRTDPDVALAGFREQLSREETAPAVLSTAERFVQETLRITARFETGDGPSAAAADAGRAATRCARGPGVERFPVQVEDGEPLALVLEPSERRLLVTAEVDVVRQVAQWVGRRLEAIERERDRLERSRHEARLVHQLVEAELRALRAQINPHFLFNSLNTIASLVHDEPALAERMTVRLARIFRHVLTQTERPFSSVKEEMEFLRAYLDIEQIRFGERLRIDFDVAPSVADSQVPSLILQPLVENAIKHGLSPKIGSCRLTISGTQEGEHVVLAVSDDGVGSPAVGTAEGTGSTGIGLRNVRERLSTLYGERARLLFESRARQGTRAAVYLPRSMHP